MIQTIFGSPVVFLKTDNIEKMFPTTVYEEVVGYLSHDEFIDHPLSRNGKICTTSGYLNSKLWTNTLDQLKELVDFLKIQALNYAHLYSHGTVKNLTFHSSWVNLTFQGCEINNHIDQSNTIEKTLIVLFYPRAPKNGSNLVFIHNSKEGQWASDCNDADLVRVVVEDGDIVIFDNFMFHAVDPHKSTIPRMCMAIEFKIEAD